MRDGCPFCDYDGPSCVLWEKGSAENGVFVIEPVNPVVPGHVLVVPRRHVQDFADDPVTTALVYGAAAEYAAHRMADANLITSRGTHATQTVMHLHVHVVPRRAEDGLALPWSAQAGPVYQYECPRDECPEVVEVRARIGNVPTPRCPVHPTVPMVLGGWRE